MEVILRIIGIITLISDPEIDPTKFEVYAFDGRNKVSICGAFVPAHSAFIKVREEKVVINNWPWIPCADGKHCKLFALDGDALTITGISTSGAFKVDPSFGNLPRLKDEYGVKDLKDKAGRKVASAATLEIMQGTVAGDELLNEMMYTIVTSTLEQQDVVIQSDKSRSITLPKGTKAEIDLLNLPVVEAIGVPGTPTHAADEEHFFLHYKVAKNEPVKDCETPVDKLFLASLSALDRASASSIDHKPTLSMATVLGYDAASVACSNSTWP
ncbi:MAG TPA: hypothetical protein VE974_15575 [Thermoanaerobaculia bacterium]|nr:hypothetical protein [Thermoanaerobaculia bacterium]